MKFPDAALNFIHEYMIAKKYVTLEKTFSKTWGSPNYSLPVVGAT